MIAVKGLVLDVLKPHRPTALEFCQQLAGLGASAHGRAARWVPVLVALVNGTSPLAISLLIISPLWLAQAGLQLPLSPLYSAVAVAAALIFLLGILLGQIAEVPWVQSGLRTLLIAGTTVALIYWLTR